MTNFIIITRMYMLNNKKIIYINKMLKIISELLGDRWCLTFLRLGLSVFLWWLSPALLFVFLAI